MAFVLKAVSAVLTDGWGLDGRFRSGRLISNLLFRFLTVADTARRAGHGETALSGPTTKHLVERRMAKQIRVLQTGVVVASGQVGQRKVRRVGESPLSRQELAVGQPWRSSASSFPERCVCVPVCLSVVRTSSQSSRVKHGCMLCTNQIGRGVVNVPLAWRDHSAA